MRIELPLLYEGFDRTRARHQHIEAEAEEFVDPLEGKDMEGHGKGGTNYWVNDDDPRPSKEEALEKLEDFKIINDIVDFLVPEEVSNNIPYWIRGPFGIAPEVAELLIEIDPLDRIED